MNPVPWFDLAVPPAEDDGPRERLVWISEGGKTYLSSVPVYVLAFGEAAGVCEFNGKAVHWRAATEF